MKLRHRNENTDSSLIVVGDSSPTPVEAEPAPRGRLKKWGKRGVIGVVIVALGSIALKTHRHSA